MSSRNEESPLPSKRRKVAESCKLCRAKKTRCDGQRPICSPCRSKNVECEYNDVTVPVSTGVLSRIEERLQRLEQVSLSTPGHSPARIVVTDSSTTLQEQLPSSARVNLIQESLEPSAGNSASESDLRFADNSAAQFMRDITKIADPQFSAQEQDFLRNRPNTWSVETDKSAMVVPKRAVADDLIMYYEQYIYPLFPILHMPTFRESYKHLWAPQKQGPFKSAAAEAAFYATLNMVFALGCLSNSKVEQQLQIRTADTFYRRARVLLPLDALDVASLEVVQYLLLTANYLSFTKYANRCSNTLAVAIRVAQTLGLHTEPELPLGNQLKREMNKRVWQHCLALERLYCSLFGRRTLGEFDDSGLLPECIDDEYLLEDGTGVQPAGLPSILDAFIVTIKTFQLLSRAREITNGLTLPELTEALQLNERIDQIEAGLPTHLKYNNDQEPTAARQQVLHLQAETVMTRIIHTRLILLRPNVMMAARRSLAPSSEQRPPSRTEMALRIEVSTLCVQTAASVIEMLHANLGSRSRIISSNAVFVTLSAATVIVAASLVPELDITVDIGNGDGSSSHGGVVAKALQILEEHRWQHEGAPGVKYQLEKFMETVSRVKKRDVNDQETRASAGASQSDAAQFPLGSLDTFADIDFNNPLWNFQWSGYTPFDFVQGSYFE